MISTESLVMAVFPSQHMMKEPAHLYKKMQSLTGAKLFIFPPGVGCPSFYWAPAALDASQKIASAVSDGLDQYALAT